MGNFNVIDILLLFGIGQGLFLGITLPIIHKKNVSANRVLTLLLLSACGCLFTRMLIHKAEELHFIQRLAPMETLIFVFGPLSFIYLKRLLEKDQHRFRLSPVHYIPAMIYLIFLIYLSMMPREEFARRVMQGQFGAVFFFAELSALLFNIYYWCLDMLFFLKAMKKEKEQLSFDQSVFSFVTVVFIASGVILSAWAISFLSSHVFNFIIPLINYDLVWIAIPVLVYVVGYFALKQPEIFKVHIVKAKIKAKGRELLNKQSSEELKLKLANLLSKEKMYLDNELTLAELSKRLDTSTNNLSWLLNNIHQTNFYNFINEYRVKAFLEKLDKGEHKSKTLLALSMEVGFNSKSTFNKVFKSFLNETPSNYVKRLAS